MIRFLLQHALDMEPQQNSNKESEPSNSQSTNEDAGATSSSYEKRLSEPVFSNTALDEYNGAMPIRGPPGELAANLSQAPTHVRQRGEMTWAMLSDLWQGFHG